MPVLPTHLGDPVIPQGSNRIATYKHDIVSNALEKAGNDMDKAAAAAARADKIRAMQDVAARTNDAERRTIDFLYGDGTNPGLYASKGVDARGAGKKFDDFFKSVKDDAMKGVTDPFAQAKLDESLGNMSNSNIRTVKSHELQESRGYSENIFKATGENAVRRSGYEYNNPETIAKSIADSDTAAGNLARLGGAAPGDEIYKGMITEGRSKVYTAQLEAMINSSDPSTQMAAAQKFQEYAEAGDLTPEAQKYFQNQFQTLRPKLVAHQAFGKFEAVRPVTAANLYSAMRGRESGGKHRGGPGSVLGPNEITTSPKGAKGLMQIMPDTAEQISRSMGGIVSAKDIIEDPATNKLAGEYYMNQQIQRFGDVRMALAAYNAGPEMVQDWMDGTNKTGKNGRKRKLGDPSKGETTVEEFIDNIPFQETKDYAQKIYRKAGGTGGEIIDLERATDYASANIEPAAQDDFIALVKNNNKAVMANNAAQAKSALSDAMTFIMQNGKGYEAMPAPLRARLDATGQTEQAKNYVNMKVSDPSAITDLLSLEPKELAEKDLDDPSVRWNLSPQDYAKWSQKKKNLDKPAMMVTETMRKQKMAEAADRRGMARTTKRDANGNIVEDRDGQQDFIRANDLLDMAIDGYAAEHGGKSPNSTELQKMVDDIFTTVTVKDGGWMYFDKTFNKYDVTLETIQDDIGVEGIARLKAAAIKAGVTPTEQQIIRQYIKINSK